MRLCFDSIKNRPGHRAVFIVKTIYVNLLLQQNFQVDDHTRLLMLAIRR